MTYRQAIKLNHNANKPSDFGGMGMFAFVPVS